MQMLLGLFSVELYEVVVESATPGKSSPWKHFGAFDQKSPCQGWGNEL